MCHRKIGKCSKIFQELSNEFGIAKDILTAEYDDSIIYDTPLWKIL